MPTTIRVIKSGILLTAFLLLVGATLLSNLNNDSSQALEDKPNIISVVYGEVAPGKIYTTLLNTYLLDGRPSHIQPQTLILNNEGQLVWNRSEKNNTLGFHKLNAGIFIITQLTDNTGRWDGVYQILNDSFGTERELRVIGNEHTDIHGAILLDSGNFIIPSYNLQKINGQYVESFLLQEIDADNQVVFEWDSINYIPLSATRLKEEQPYWIENGINDYFHGNYIDEFPNQDLLISGRNVSQIIRIAKNSGEVIWKLGGTDSDFVFLNDPLGGFSAQHSATVLENGNVLLYDNGNEHTPPQTRVVEYALDESKGTATLVWAYLIKGKFTYATGSVQRLPNGHTLIGWGMEVNNSSSSVRISEVDVQGNPVLEVFFPEGAGLYSANKYE